MVTSFTPNVQLQEPARGDLVGTWDTPINSNMTVLDLIVGGIATVPVNNSNITLSAAQFQSRNITFNSTLTASINVFFPSSFTKSYEIQNLATGSSAFTISAVVTGSTGQLVTLPPGQTVDIFNDGLNLKFKNLPPVGTYLDYAGSNAPTWVLFCSVPPYLVCNGGTFSSSTYPALAAILGGTTLPDLRGCVPANLDQGAGRLTNISGLFQVGGDQNLQSHNHGGVTGTENQQHNHLLNGGAAFAAGSAIKQPIDFVGGNFSVPIGASFIPTGTTNESAQHNHNITTSGTGNGQNLQPTTIVGITMIRAG